MKRRSLPAVLALVVGLAAGLTGGWLGSSRADSPAAAGPPVVLAQSPVGSSTFAKLAETVKPAVINVSVQSKGGRTPLEEFYGEEYFKRFFGDAPERMPRRGLGSGVIIDPAGIALTNAHVVDKATEIEVVTVDGAKHKAKVLGVDTKTDLAVLKLDDGKRKFPFLRLGDSNETQVGDWVMAVGSPFGLQATVTVGIISAKARQIGAGPYDDFLQTDAAINPGNSGGPLVNMRGEVVGINTAIVRGGSGIGFAIPASMAKRISSQLLADGKVTRGWLGVAIQPLTPELAESFDAKGRKGALISSVTPDSPAARAGLKSGDIVLEFNGQKVEGPSELARVVAMAPPGQTAKITVWRDRQPRTLEVKLDEMPSERTAAARSSSLPGRLGLEVQPVTPEVARQLDLDAAEGVVIARVEDGSAADDAGLQRGDVIVEVNRKPVRTMDDFESATKAARPDRYTMKVRRGGNALYVAVVPGKSDKN
jgi:serine protease Do